MLFLYLFQMLLQILTQLVSLFTLKIRLKHFDEAGFGRINRPKYCWCEREVRPSVPCHHIREYRYAYGAVEPLTRESRFLIMPYCDTECMNLFLKELSEQYSEDMIML